MYITIIWWFWWFWWLHWKDKVFVEDSVKVLRSEKCRNCFATVSCSVQCLQHESYNIKHACQKEKLDPTNITRNQNGRHFLKFFNCSDITEPNIGWANIWTGFSKKNINIYEIPDVKWLKSVLGYTSIVNQQFIFHQQHTHKRVPRFCQKAS